MNGLDPVEPEINDLADARSPLARTLQSVGASLLVGVLVVALVLGLGRLTRSTEVHVAQFTADPTQPLRLVVDGLDVRLVPVAGTAITVEAQLVEGWLGTDFEATQSAGDIELRASCTPLVIPGCGGDVTIGVPHGSQFELEAAASDVVLDGIDGIDGVVTVRTTSGDIDGVDLATVDLTTTSTAGDIDLAFRTDPAGLKVTSDSGDIDIEVPGRVEHDVMARSGRGEVDSDLPASDNGADSFIAIETISGDIDLSTP